MRVTRNPKEEESLLTPFFMLSASAVEGRRRKFLIKDLAIRAMNSLCGSAVTKVSEIESNVRQIKLRVQ